MNQFYKQSQFLQWFEAVLLLVIGFYPAIVIIELSYSNLIFSLLFFLYVPIGQFITTPIFKLTGIYTYYSPMLLGYMANDNHIDLHSGLSFDYLFVMRKYKAGLEHKNKLIAYHLEGLLTIIAKIESGILPSSVSISGTSYFFNQRTINKLGFELNTPSLFYRLDLFVNFIDLFWMYSLSKGRLSMPHLWKAKKASISGSKLLANKNLIEDLQKRISIRTRSVL